MAQLKSFKKGEIVLIKGESSPRTISKKTDYGYYVYFTDGDMMRGDTSAERYEADLNEGLDIDVSDLTVTSKEDAEKLAKDRIDPYVFQLKDRIEAHIQAEWMPGKTIELKLNEVETLIARALKLSYELEGWTVQLKTRMGNTIFVIS